MRWFAAIPFAFLPLAGGAAPAAPSGIPPGGEIRLSAPDHCDPIRNVRRTDAPGRPEARRLDRLPTASLDLAVMRQVDNCPEPVTIREGYGAVEGPRAVKQPRTPAVPRARLLGR